MTIEKTTGGNFFEDFQRGSVITHAVPRTIWEGDMALYIALTGDRRPLHCAREFAQSLGFEREVVHDLLTFHMVFGRAVPDVSREASRGASICWTAGCSSATRPVC